YGLTRLEAAFSMGFTRVTTEIGLRGGGHEGRGEDVSYEASEHDALHAAGPVLPLAGRWTVASFCAHLATLDQWPAPPEWAPSRLYRNWAYESAALDLALRQAGTALHDVLGVTPRPLRFVNSLGVGEPPSAEPVRARRALYPALRFKLDATASWDPDLIAELAGTGAVDVIDFKGHYGQEVPDVDALAAMYRTVIDAFPDALLEDPHDLPEITALVAPHVARVSYDAPVHTAADVDALPLPPRLVNVKPSRTGGLRSLSEVYGLCETRGIGMYGGGQGELGVGRGHIQLLAALVHPDTPNDVAPSPYNLPEPPPGLPGSPLDPAPDAIGFRRRA
ncbi:MAG TPA: hypothetical protein VNT51_11715, partial [Miltoncostaeaceae bacterium]|nr:hypothetical protein [Miltoncostaeaceae bacterium]